MRNKLLLFSAVVVLCILPVLSFGQTGTDAKAAKQETIKEVIDAKNSVEEIKQNAINKIIERTNQFVDIIFTRYEAATNRLDILATRIDSRIAKMNEKGVNVSEATKLLAEARTKIKTAEKSTAGITATFGVTVAEVKKDFATIKKQMETAKKEIQIAHAALIDVVNILKPGQNKLEQENMMASTTKN